MTNDLPETRPWSADELDWLERAALIRVAPARLDGTLRPFVTIGHVRLGQEELVRSLNGPDGTWYLAAVASGQGEIEVDGHRIPVAFVPDGGRAAEVDRALYSRYGDDSGVRRMTSAAAREATLRVVPLA